MKYRVNERKFMGLLFVLTSLLYVITEIGRWLSGGIDLVLHISSEPTFNFILTEFIVGEIGIIIGCILLSTERKEEEKIGKLKS